MKKKLLTLVLSTLMLLFIAPKTVFADDYIAKIGSNEYQTLQAAIDAVNDGETIEIIQDFTQDSLITINNGKTFTIDFVNKKFTWGGVSGATTDKDIYKDIFTIEGNSNVTIKNMEYKKSSDEIKANTIFKVNSTGTLTLENMICNSAHSADEADIIRDTLVVNNGGTVTIDGGNIDILNAVELSILNPVVQNLGGTTTFKGDGIYTTQNNTGAAWIGNVITSPDPSADPNNNCGTVIIENGIFKGGHILDVNGKANITINDATTDTQNGPAIKTFHGGIKSNITINNITSSTMVFSQVIEELETNIDFKNGNVKYYPSRFCINSGGGAIIPISIRNGKFGPNSGSENIQVEITGYLASGAEITALTGDPDGYTYKVETVTPPPTPPTPPSPTPEPDPDPTPAYVIPNTGVEGTPTNNHSLLKISSLSLLAVGTYMVIKKKKDN